jgi:hypothetical protein
MSTRTCPGCGGCGTVPDYAKAPVRQSNVTVRYQEKPCSVCGGTGSVKGGGGEGTGCLVLLVLAAALLGGALLGLVV